MKRNISIFQIIMGSFEDKGLLRLTAQQASYNLRNSKALLISRFFARFKSHGGCPMLECCPAFMDLTSIREYHGLCLAQCGAKGETSMCLEWRLAILRVL